MIVKTLDTSILLGLYETAILMRQQNMEYVAKKGLTNQQWLILTHLAKDPNLPFLIRQQREQPLMASELAESLRVTRANITNLLTILMNKGLIKQIEDKHDRRKKRLVLTINGETLIKELQPDIKLFNAKVMKGLTNTEKEQFLGYIQKCTENIQSLKTF